MGNHKTVLLDSNFLIDCGKLRIDACEEIRRLVPCARLATVKPVIRELEKLKKKTALALAQYFQLKILDAEGAADQALLDTAMKTGGVVCTNDKALKNRCAAKKVTVIFIRNKKKLEMW